ncbi:PrsW family intramembrane metalloprotease [Methanocella sp. CWC-04]|uniref:PrsW family intramembrane metalloprotease n=2 Tax=Methanooceanicella nereidis TaxID=2052831 RepID=A0AAP2W5X9_9EURY|nr:PrsW family intramembrane metalloprotease [Methanocella sp. CWC-04]
MLLLFTGALPASSLSQADGSDDSFLDQVFTNDSFSKRTLVVELISSDIYDFNGAKANRNISLTVTNPENSYMDVYLAYYRNDKWVVLGKLGSMGPGEMKIFNYPVEFSYAGRTTETDRFGVIGKVNGKYLSNVVSVEENWVQYEKSLKQTLSVFGVISAGTLFGILIIVMAGVYVVASQTKHEEVAGPGEYTLKTLFIPIAGMRPLSEKIANIIVNPFFWAVELVGGGILVFLILAYALTDIRADIGILVFIVGGMAALFMPIIFLVIGWLADYYEREPFRFIISMFMWGILATVIAFFINTAFSLFTGMMVSAGLSAFLLAVFVAPVVEEIAKGTGLLIIAGHHEFDDTFDGILYGFAVGMGFAAVENWLYFASNASPVAVGGLTEWTYNILYRSFLCALAHGCFTAAIGGTIGYLKARTKTRGYAYIGFFLGLPIAIILHATFNFTAYLDAIMQTAFGLPVPVFDPILTIGATLVYVLVGIKLQKRIKSRRNNENPPGPEG